VRVCTVLTFAAGLPGRQGGECDNLLCTKGGRGEGSARTQEEEMVNQLQPAARKPAGKVSLWPLTLSICKLEAQQLLNPEAASPPELKHWKSPASTRAPPPCLQSPLPEKDSGDPGSGATEHKD
jgi:hypothetical protein